MVTLSPPVSPVKFTYEDFLLFPEDGKRRELIDGEMFVRPSPWVKHQAVLGNLFLPVSNFSKRTRRGRVFIALVDVVLSSFDVLEPDLVYISDERAAIVAEKNIQGAPDLIVEILSEWSRKTDEIVKRKLYERHGVSEYWIIDPELETVKVYRSVDGRYVRVAELAREADATLTSPQFPGLSIPLIEIFG